MQRLCCYLLAGEAGGAPVPLLPAPEPEPVPLELGAAPELPVLPAPGVDVAPPALEPLPLVMPSSFKHFSCSAPTMPRHLLLELPEALLELLLGEALLGELLLGEALLGELLLGEALLGELLLGEALLLPDAPAEPAAPPDELSDELLPVAPALLPALPAAPPDEEPELCASVTLESAKSAAAVAALMSFNVISVFLLTYLVVPEAPPLLLPEPMPEPLLELGSFGAPLLPDAPLLGVLLLGELLLGELLLVPPLLLGELLDAAPEPDFLKCASHSSREICPSLFLSTVEKLGVCVLAPLEAPDFGSLEAPPDALLPVALGDEDAPLEALPEDLLSVAPALELEPLGFAASLPVLLLELCASATLASANSAAAVAVPTTLTNMNSS